MRNIIREGKPPERMALPLERTDLVGRKFARIRDKDYCIDVWPYPHDKELCWTVFMLSDGTWPKIPCFTRSEERRFPKTVAKMATEFLERLKNRSKIIVVIEGGLVQDVIKSDESLEVVCRDYDTEYADENILTKDEEGRECYQTNW